MERKMDDFYIQSPTFFFSSELRFFFFFVLGTLESLIDSIVGWVVIPSIVAAAARNVSHTSLCLIIFFFISFLHSDPIDHPMAIFEYFTSSFHHLDSNVPEVEDSPPCHAHTWTCGAVFSSSFLFYIYMMFPFFSLLGERPRPGTLFSFIPTFINIRVGRVGDGLPTRIQVF